MRALLATPVLVLAANVLFVPPASSAGRAVPTARGPADARLAAAALTGARVAELPLASPEDYRRAAGRRVGDTLVVTLEARRARWRPQGSARVEVPVFVFAEPGQPARVPGPMLRVSEGGIIRLTLRNTLDKRMTVRGLVSRASRNIADSIALLPGRDTTVTFAAGAPGSTFYWGRTTPTVRHRIAPIPDWMWGGEAEEGPFLGALVVDAKGTVPDPRERTFVITRWLDEYLPGLADTVDWKMAVNGGSYPNTEPLSYTMGDTVRWRVINATLASHPMHLHGFYFTTTGRGAVDRWQPVAPGDRRQVVTEFLDVGGAMTMEWVPERPGNWLFHCHLTRHMSGMQAFPAATSTARARGGPTDHGGAHDAHEHQMAGLVLGITVRAPRIAHGARLEQRAAGRGATPRTERPVRLLAHTRQNVFGTRPGFAFVQQTGARAPASDSITIPSAPLILRRGEATRITVVNTLPSPLAVHWHGMELESWYDGVGGFSGMGSRMRAPIPPRDSFVVRFTPPRAGTFMFHTHDEGGDELASGLYGALLVLDDPAAYDPRRDHTLLLATYGPGDSGVVAVNGRRTPDALTLDAGVMHRLRFASIPSNERVEISLVKRGADTTQVVQQWQLLALDGAEFAPSQRTTVRASRLMSAGMTMDVGFTMPAEFGYALRIRMLPYEAFDTPGTTVLVPLVPRP